MTTPQHIVSMLTYRSYTYNRDRSPDISVARWGRIYGEEAVAAMEKQFQSELASRSQEAA